MLKENINKNGDSDNFYAEDFYTKAGPFLIKSYELANRKSILIK
jgi:hypothetical protein